MDVPLLLPLPTAISLHQVPFLLQSRSFVWRIEKKLFPPFSSHSSNSFIGPTTNTNRHPRASSLVIPHLADASPRASAPWSAGASAPSSLVGQSLCSLIAGRLCSLVAGRLCSLVRWSPLLVRRLWSLVVGRWSPLVAGRWSLVAGSLVAGSLVAGRLWSLLGAAAP
ncbi:hypothetical protein Syun_012295 [Stephania yunnanensis]|uniref:Uncharacterized protein n=1 Tax=Stephania yunnanensis TaxID=152371 RepID=A0AAP0K072_9MAGN